MDTYYEDKHMIYKYLIYESSRIKDRTLRTEYDIFQTLTYYWNRDTFVVTCSNIHIHTFKSTVDNVFLVSIVYRRIYVIEAK